MKAAISMRARVYAQLDRGDVHTVTSILPHRPRQLERLIARPDRGLDADRLADIQDLHVLKE
jgi:hypothetical protein